MRRTTLGLLLLAAAGLSLTASAGAHEPDEASEPGEKKEIRRMILVHHGEGGGSDLAILDPAKIDGDRLRIEDLASLLPGEERSYSTAGGREVTVTRGEGERYTIAVEGKTIHIGGELDETEHAGLPRKRVLRLRHEVEEGEADAKAAEEIEEEIDITMLAAGDEAEGEPVVIEIVGEDEEGKVERRVIVLRTSGQTQR